MDSHLAFEGYLSLDFSLLLERTCRTWATGSIFQRVVGDKGSLEAEEAFTAGSRRMGKASRGTVMSRQTRRASSLQEKLSVTH